MNFNVWQAKDLKGPESLWSFKFHLTELNGINILGNPNAWLLTENCRKLV